MDLAALTTLIDWITQRPILAELIVFLVALSESLAVVGLIVPGAFMMFAAGALVAAGALDLWITIASAVAGAIAGDGISFWLGRRYRDRLYTVRLLRRHPEWLARGQAFFSRHGGMGVFLGRFVGPMRAIIPLVAGTMGLRPARFFAANLFSALLWAPAYLLPGIVFGTALALAGQVAKRLAVLLALMVAALWLIVWFVRWSYRSLHPRVASLADRALAWGREHPLVGRVVTRVLDPTQPAPRALFAMAVLLVAAMWLFLGIMEDVVTGDPLVRVDVGVYQLMRGLRTPWGDHIMVLATELGDVAVIAPLVVVVLSVALWMRRWRTAAYWLAAVSFGAVVVQLLKLMLHVPRPAEVAGLGSYAFPSGHATMAIVVYGFIAALVGRGVAAPYRSIPYSIAGLLIVAIAASRLYLGAHWLSDVLGGLTLGLAWITLLAIAYQRHVSTEPPMRALHLIVPVTLVLAGTWHVYTNHASDLQRYAPRYKIQRMDAQAWWDRKWQTLPAHRIDLEGEYEQPLNIQWAGSLECLREHLTMRGWRQPPALNVVNTLRWLQPAARLADLPILPQVNEGRHEVLALVRPLSAPSTTSATTFSDRQLVLRLWPADRVVGDSDTPLWVGTVSRQKASRILLITLPRTENEFDAPIAALQEGLNGLSWRRAMRPSAAKADHIRWQGTVLLAREPRRCKSPNPVSIHSPAVDIAMSGSREPTLAGS